MKITALTLGLLFLAALCLALLSVSCAEYPFAARVVTDDGVFSYDPKAGFGAEYDARTKVIPLPVVEPASGK